MKNIIIAENIRSIYNVGSMFRTADGVGVEKIILVGYTATPVDRFGNKNMRLNKTALSSEDSVKWESHKTIEEAIGSVKNTHRIVSVEINKNSIPYTDIGYDKPTAFIFGNEVDGVSEKALSMSDKIIHIPMKGKKESLNVANTTSVILYNSIK